MEAGESSGEANKIITLRGYIQKARQGGGGRGYGTNARSEVGGGRGLHRGGELRAEMEGVQIIKMIHDDTR